jgi:hypothetical protein
MKISSISGIDSVNYAVMFKHVTAIDYKESINYSTNKESIYCACSGKIGNFLNCSVHESLLLIFVIVLITLFWSLNILLLTGGVPLEYYTIRHYGVKIRKVNHFQ